MGAIEQGISRTFYAFAMLVVVALATLAIIGSSAGAAEGGEMRATAAPHPVAAAPVPAPKRCDRPAPTSAKGYAEMFAALTTDEFGAADVGISVPLRDGRSVWLFGDTFSDFRFVHSTAITQDGGCLHVSRGGDQMLPNLRTVPVAERTRANAEVAYWIESAREVAPGVLAITAEEQRMFGQGVWDFEYTGRTRTARATVDAEGNVTFDRWTATATVSAADPGALVPLGDHHFGYSVRTHPEVKLASGKSLTTMAQNYDDGKLRPVEAYRLIFTEK